MKVTAWEIGARSVATVLWCWDGHLDAPSRFVGLEVSRETKDWDRYSEGRRGWVRQGDGCFMGWEGSSVYLTEEECLAAEIMARGKMVHASLAIAIEQVERLESLLLRRKR